MFDIGFWELALIFALGLVVLGPEKLPKVAAKLGRYAGQARRMARTLTAQIQDEMDAEERRSRTPAQPPGPEPKPVFNRPGVDELIPRSTPDASPAPAPAPTEDAETAHRPQP